eukprot:1146872-Pelagomonas_calceolata.AAC.4
MEEHQARAAGRDELLLHRMRINQARKQAAVAHLISCQCPLPALSIFQGSAPTKAADSSAPELLLVPPATWSAPAEAWLWEGAGRDASILASLAALYMRSSSRRSSAAAAAARSNMGQQHDTSPGHSNTKQQLRQQHVTATSHSKTQC